MKLRQIAQILFVLQSGFAFHLDASQGSGWNLIGSYGVSEDKAVFDISRTGLITAPGGISYTSVSSGKIKFELDRNEAALEVYAPRWGAFKAGASIGSLNYEVALPSGVFVNHLKEGDGYSAGVMLAWEGLAQTLVTPQVEFSTGWKMARIKLRRFIGGQDGASRDIENRLRTDKYFLGCNVRRTYQSWAPEAGVEIFRLDAELMNEATKERNAGDRLGYAISAGIARKIYRSGFLKLNGFLGDEMGYRFSLKQEF